MSISLRVLACGALAAAACAAPAVDSDLDPDPSHVDSVSQAARCTNCGGEHDPPDPGSVCGAGSTQACVNSHGCTGQKVCSADGNHWGSCTGGGTTNCACTPGAKRACDYRGAAGTSHCALGEQTCSADGNSFGACSDPTYQCGTWGSIDMKECASTGVAKHAGVLIDIPSGDDRRAYVLNHKATVFGVAMNAKAFTTDIWDNAWGSFAVPNTSCFVYDLSYLRTCSSPFSGSILYRDPQSGMTFREAAGFPCMSNCFGTSERRVYNREPRWGIEEFPSGGGGPERCETLIGKTFAW